MSLVQTEAIVLKNFPFGDSSKIAHCYTREYGRIALIAKGVRKGKLLQSSYFEPLSYINLIFYHNPKRQLQIFSKSEFIDIWKNVKSDIKKIAYGLAILELIDKSVSGEQPHIELFQLLVNVFNRMDLSNGNMNQLFWYFELHLLKLLGFDPSLEKCAICSATLSTAVLYPRVDSLLCKSCSEKHINEVRKMGDRSMVGQLTISSLSLAALRLLSSSSMDQLQEIATPPQRRREIGKFLDIYLKVHIEGFREIQSLSVLEKIV